MADYAIGDIQGCDAALVDLLGRIDFRPGRDRLWFAGDLVARGPDSLAVLRRVRALGESARVVLGNHDLHLLANYYNRSPAKKKDRTADILASPDVDALMRWLRKQPLFLDIPDHRAVLTHAGIPPCWSVEQARLLAMEVEVVLQNDVLIGEYFGGMYGNTPTRWDEALTGPSRWRVITNYLTRMRLSTPSGELEFNHKEGLNDLPPGWLPWFAIPNPGLDGYRVLFGHWAALEGNGPAAPIIALDGGCVWGGSLIAYRLDDHAFFSTRAGCEDCGLG